MPMYEYECPACGQPFEKRVPMADADRVACPHCGNAKTKRRLSKIVVKGSQGAGSSGAYVPPITGGT